MGSGSGHVLSSSARSPNTEVAGYEYHQVGGKDLIGGGSAYRSAYHCGTHGTVDDR